MPSPVRPRLPQSATARSSTPGTYVVRPGDTLSAIAARQLGDAGRWREIYEANRQAIGANPGAIRPGMALRMPGAPEAPPQKPAEPARGGWSQETARDFEAFVALRAEALAEQGVEIDCADLAAKLLADFTASRGLPDPLAGAGAWHRYDAQRPGGLPNVAGDNWVRTGLSADSLAKGHTRRVNDADGDGIQGYDAAGAVDVDDLSPGDLLFFDWDDDGQVDHTVNVLGVAPDGTVTLAFGTYDNLAPGQPLKWENLDLKPVQVLRLAPGSEDYMRYLGAGNKLWGVRRYNELPDKAPPPPPPPAPPPPPPPPKPPTLWQRTRNWLSAHWPF